MESVEGVALPAAQHRRVQPGLECIARALFNTAAYFLDPISQILQRFCSLHLYSDSNGAEITAIRLAISLVLIGWGHNANHVLHT